MLFLLFAVLSFVNAVDFCQISQIENHYDKRIIVIGDVHGSQSEFMRILAASNITNGIDCNWLPQSKNTLLLQIGDIVDRGPGSTEVWECIEKLQSDPPEHSHVVRLMGNHELMWLQGSYRDKHPTADTNEKVTSIVSKIKKGILDSSILGSYLERMNDVPVIFVHAGFRPQMVDWIREEYKSGSTPTPEDLSSIVNEQLRLAVSACGNQVACPMRSPLFGAGPERGGRDIGGPFWTDYRVLAKAAAGQSFEPDMIQV
jgi:hypothetical protein